MSKSVLSDIEQHFDKVKPKKYSPHPLFDNFGEIISKEQAKKNLQLDPNYKYILFFGLIRDYKGLDLFLDAFAKEEFRKLPLKIIVAGEYYTDPKPYKDQMERLGLMPHIIEKAEFITDSQVGNYFCASDLVVQPYKHATQSGVTQIAYHFNKPMIVTNVGGLPEMIPHEKVGYVVEPNANDLASAMLKFYSAEKENEFVENVKIEKEKYAWSKMVNTIEDLYSEIIKK
jgi:glycosyltransferase involved in cell wall biosynthesis